MMAKGICAFANNSNLKVHPASTGMRRAQALRHVRKELGKNRWDDERISHTIALGGRA